MISLVQLRELLEIYYRIFKEARPFFAHPFSLLVNYPEAELIVSDRMVLAKDWFGEYMPFLYENKDMLDRAEFVSGLVFAQLSELPRGCVQCVDWEFVYDSSILRRFKRRSYLLNRAEKVGLRYMILKGKDVLTYRKRLLDIVQSWYSKSQFFTSEANITAESIERCLDFTFENLTQEILPEDQIFSVIVVQDKRVVGFSFSIIDCPWMYEVFEFTSPDWRWISTYLFYRTVLVGFEFGANWIDTLGFNGIDGLRYNKEWYKPCSLMPQYRWENCLC